METFQTILFLLVFVVMALSMFFRKIPALLALPLMAFLFPLIGGVSLNDTLQLVIGQGALRLHRAYTVMLFGSMLSILMQKTKVAENLIKKGAELSGDNPWIISVMMLFLISLLFTTLGGLGAIIMVATIVLPIMTSVGVGPLTVVGVFLFGLSIGGILNAGNWAVYVDVLKLPVGQIRSFALIMFALTFVTGLVYITIQLYQDGHNLNFKKIITNSVVFVVVVMAFIMLYQFLGLGQNPAFQNFLSGFVTFLKTAIGVILIALFLFNVLRIFFKKKEEKSIHWSAFLSPVLPLFLILLYDIDFIAAFICGLVYALVATWKKGSLNVFLKSILEGGAVVMPALVLMLGIGMLLNAIIGPGAEWNAANPEGWPVLNVLKPFIMAITPKNPLQYVLIFTLAAPLALYRGPLNVWGMGYGIAAVFLASGMPAGAVMGVLLSVGQVQGISDPTNTHNVWLANEMQQNVQKVLWNTLPYTWGVAVVGLTVASLIFY
ncbi:MAG: citrate transporter [Candidatus Marinimicrobia bacterium]|nr:citrate transporter [Candidatus Neomarinimicrobiota bacterium]